MSSARKLFCPFCGREVKLVKAKDTDLVSQFSAEELEKSYIITHEAVDETDCPIATLEGDMLGTLIYESKKEAIDIWSRRSGK